MRDWNGLKSKEKARELVIFKEDNEKEKGGWKKGGEKGSCMRCKNLLEKKKITLERRK